jgi:hypothetical protein
MRSSRLIDYTKHRRDDMPSRADSFKTEIVKNTMKSPLNDALMSPSKFSTMTARATATTTSSRGLYPNSSHSERTKSMGESTSAQTAPIEFYLKRVSLDHRQTRRRDSERSREDLLLQLERRTSSSRFSRIEIEGQRKYDVLPEGSLIDRHYDLEGKMIVCPKPSGKRYNHIQRILRNPTLSRSFPKENDLLNTSRSFLRSESEPTLTCQGSKAA